MQYQRKRNCTPLHVEMSDIQTVQKLLSWRANEQKRQTTIEFDGINGK